MQHFNLAKYDQQTYPNEYLSFLPHLEITVAIRPVSKAVQSKNIWNESEIKPKLKRRKKVSTDNQDIDNMENKVFNITWSKRVWKFLPSLWRDYSNKGLHQKETQKLQNAISNLIHNLYGFLSIHHYSKLLLVRVKLLSVLCQFCENKFLQ